MTVRNITIKDTKDLGVFSEVLTLQLQDNNIEAVVLTYKGETLRITKNGAYSETLKLSKEQPKEIVTKFRLHGTFAGIAEVDKVFEDKYEAEEAKRQFERDSGQWDSSLEIEEIQVEQDVTKLN